MHASLKSISVCPVREGLPSTESQSCIIVCSFWMHWRYCCFVFCLYIISSHCSPLDILSYTCLRVFFSALLQLAVVTAIDCLLVLCYRGLVTNVADANVL